MRRIAPAAAAAAPAGMRPTSSAPTTLDTARMGLRLDPLDDVVQGRCFPVLDVHAHLRTARTRERQTECSHTGKPTARLTHDRRDCTRDL